MNRRDDGTDFGSGFGGSFGTSGGYDPHRQYEGTYTTRGVMRDGSRVPRQHEDEHPQHAQGHSRPSIHQEHGGFSNYAGGGNRDRLQGVGGREHLSENAAQRFANHQHGYGQSQHPQSPQSYGSPSDMGFGERAWEQRETGPHYGKGPKGYKRSDERIREEVCEVMSRQGYVDASDVEVVVEGGVVRLSGTVATRNDKRALEQMADGVHGVDEVRNEIRLRRDNVAQAQSGQPASQRALPQNPKTAQS